VSRRGRFITLEGGEGVGKTTNLNYVCEFLKNRGIEVVATREPGGVPKAEQLRALLLGQSWLPEAELLLFFAARLHHVRELILPALAAGKWVVSDRFTDASFAYQGGGRGLSWQRIQYLKDWLLEGLQPDLTLLLDAPVEVGLARAQARGKLNRFETENLEFQKRVRRAYCSLWQQQPERIKRIDAARPLSEVQLDIAGHLKALVEGWRN
jgi:dTMP kinase